MKHDSNKGAVYIYKKNEGGNDNWGYFQKVMLGNAFENDNFGYSMSANTKSLIVGAVFTQTFPGQAYLIAYNDALGNWGVADENFNYNENSMVKSNNVRVEGNGDYFGSSISIGNTYGIIGGNLADISGNDDTGVAYIIQDTGEGYWEVRKRILSDDLQAGDEFGFSVGLSGRYAIVGAWLEDEPLNGGASYVLNIPEMEGGPRCLIYDQDTGRWKAGTVSSAGAGVLVQQLDDLTNFDVTSNDPATPVVAAFAEGAAVISNEVIQSWIQEEKVIVDIVWVIDNSGSMFPYQSMLANNMEAFMNIFLSYAPDFKMMFITTDSSLIRGIVDTGSRDPVAYAADLVSTTGTMGSGFEKGIQQLYDCISAGGACHAELRGNATLVAIFLSDEPDHSSTTINSMISLADHLRPGNFVPYGIFGDVPTGCSNPTSHGAQPGWGYYDLVHHYASQWWSICDEDWGSQMEEIAQAVSVQTEFRLDGEDPHVDTIRVWVNGQLVEEGWEYNPTHNSVVFTLEDAPQPGDSLDIGYSTWGCGEE